MSVELGVFVFPGPKTARQVLNEVQDRQLAWIDEVAVVERPRRGPTRVHSSWAQNGFLVEYPTGSGHRLSIEQIADDLSRRLVSIFLRGPDGRRPVFGGTEVMQTDPHWRDYVLFQEYFRGDNGAGVGASHQTGWTANVANLLDHVPDLAAALSRSLASSAWQAD